MADAERLLSLEAKAQQVDKEQSEVMHQQWRLFCEQLATITGEAVVMHSEIREMSRRVHQEEKDRRAAIDAVHAALRSSEERTFGILQAKLEDISLKSTCLEALVISLEDKTRIHSRGDQDLMRKLQDGLGIAVRERSELACAVKSMHEKLMAQISTVESGVSSNQSNIQAHVADLTAQVENLTTTVRARVAMDEKLVQSLRAHEQLQVQLSNVECGVSNIKSFVTDLNAKVDSRTSTVQVDSAHWVAVEEKLEQSCKAHENLKVQVREVESGVSNIHNRMMAVVTDLTARVESLTSTIKADSVPRLAAKENLEQSCKALRVDLEQALDKVHVGFRLEMTEFRGKKDEFERALSQSHGALQKEVKEHKESTEKLWLLFQNDVQDHKAQFEEEKCARDAAHSNLESQLRNHDRAHKGLNGKMDDFEERLRSALCQLDAKQQTHADSTSSIERELRDEIVKMQQGALTEQLEVERKLREEFSRVHSTLETRIADLWNGLDGKEESLRKMVIKDVEALSSSFQEEVGLRIAAEARLNSRCDGLREEHAALREELLQHSLRSQELEAAIWSANEEIRKEFADHKTSVQLESDSVRSQLQRNYSPKPFMLGNIADVSGNSSPSPFMFGNIADVSGYVHEGDMQQIMQSHSQMMDSHLRNHQTTLRHDLADLEQKLHKEMGQSSDQSSRMSPPQSPPRGPASSFHTQSTSSLHTRSTSSLQGADTPDLGAQGSLRSLRTAEVAPGVASQVAFFERAQSRIETNKNTKAMNSARSRRY